MRVNQRELDVNGLFACETHQNLVRSFIMACHGKLVMESFSLWLARLILVMRDFMRAIPATSMTPNRRRVLSTSLSTFLALQGLCLKHTTTALPCAHDTYVACKWQSVRCITAGGDRHD